MFSSSKGPIKATLVDSALIVAFPSAREPRIWRIDMGQFMSSALEVKETQGRFALVVKPGAGPAEEIGVFQDRKKALEAMQVITDAFLRGSQTHIAPKKGGGFFKFLKSVFILLLVALTALVVWSKTHNPVNPDDVVQTPPVQTGVPVPADQVLGH